MMHETIWHVDKQEWQKNNDRFGINQKEQYLRTLSIYTQTGPSRFLFDEPAVCIFYKRVLYAGLEVKVVLCVVIADIFYHLTYTLFFITSKWNESILYVLTYEITQCAAEILMAWV